MRKNPHDEYKKQMRARETARLDADANSGPPPRAETIRILMRAISDILRKIDSAPIDDCDQITFAETAQKLADIRDLSRRLYETLSGRIAYITERRFLPDSPHRSGNARSAENPKGD